MEQVDATVARMFATWKVLAFYADVREWESFTKVSWPAEHGADLVMWAEKATTRDPQPIAWDMRGHLTEFTKAAELCAAEIEDGSITHDGDPRVARHVMNARRRVNRYGVSIGKESRGSQKKIDAAVCVVGVRMVRRYVQATGWEPRRPKRAPARLR